MLNITWFVKDSMESGALQESESQVATQLLVVGPPKQLRSTLQCSEWLTATMPWLPVNRIKLIVDSSIPIKVSDLIFLVELTMYAVCLLLNLPKVNGQCWCVCVCVYVCVAGGGRRESRKTGKRRIEKGEFSSETDTGQSRTRRIKNKKQKK